MKALVAIALLAIVAVPAAVYGEQILWDLQIRAEMGDDVVQVGQAPTVIGKVTDHAGMPVDEARVTISTASRSYIAVTGESGFFGRNLIGFNGLPGEYVVNVGADKDGQLGRAVIDFVVTGEVKKSQILFEKIKSKTAQKYIHADPASLEGNLVGQRLYDHYRPIYEAYMEALVQERQMELERKKAQEIRDEAAVKLDEHMAEHMPGAGVYDGRQYEVFLDNLDLSVKETIHGQINYTKDVFYDARRTMEAILAGGGTYEEARQAYLDRLTISKESMIRFTDGEPPAGNATEAEPEAEPEPEVDIGQLIREKAAAAGGKEFQVVTVGTSIYVKIGDRLDYVAEIP